ncbi:unnamed protein product [Triticum turgidum subsp. durum]|uniref:Uncharacterized protein n=1 Tax=Triticum turgidum subsp. durum TaxID=4567 RepID=A0A9R0TXM8_TRITD|nr:unnamed protein product [Triticum turgidum subsp. durum]
MDRVDVDSSIINLEGQGVLELCDKNMNYVFGLPCGDSTIQAEGVELSAACIEYTRVAASFSDRGTHSLKAAEAYLSRCIIESSTYKIKDWNWGGYVLKNLFQAVKKFKADVLRRNPTVHIVGCHLFLQLFVPDSLELGVLNRARGVTPLIGLYDYESIKNMVEKITVNVAPGEVSFHGAASAEKLGILLREQNARGLANITEIRQAF